MRIRGDPLAAGLLPEVQKLFLCKAAFDEGAGVDAGRGVTLYEDKISPMRLRRRMPEVHEAGVVKRCGGLEGGDMSAKLRAFLVGLDDDSRRVPADRRANAFLDLAVAGVLCLGIGRNGVDVGGIGGERDPAPRTAGHRHHFIEQVVCPARALEGDHR
jgi:hypothetical protein